MDVVVDLHLWADIELTLDEVEALVLASPDVWCSYEDGIPGRIQ